MAEARQVSRQKVQRFSAWHFKGRAAGDSRADARQMLLTSIGEHLGKLFMNTNTNMHIQRRKPRRALTALLMSAALLVTTAVTPLPAFAAAGSTKSSLINVNTPSKEEIVQFMQAHPTGDIYFDADGKSTGKTHETAYLTVPRPSAPYAAGRLAESEAGCSAQHHQNHSLYRRHFSNLTSRRNTVSWHRPPRSSTMSTAS